MLMQIILLQGLTLLMLGPACEASSLGMTVHVVPLESDEGRTVRAHFSVIASGLCPSLSDLCAEGEDCLVHSTSLPFTGTKPSPGWCVRQWQKTVPSDYQDVINLGSDTGVYVSMKAGPTLRGNSARLNHPAYVAPLPPFRARVNCAHHFHLSVKDLDGDKVRCRFASAEDGECLDCSRHSFIELDEDKCMITFTGNASAGLYFIYLMAEDLIPIPRMNQITDNTPLSSIPVHLSLTVEESNISCVHEPLATDETPHEDSTMFVVPYEEVKFNVNYVSEEERILEVAVVGSPGLQRVAFTTVGPLAFITIGWVRSDNKLATLLPVCFAANTETVQSEPRCVWLHQKETMTLPEGTELKCSQTEMTLLLPIASLVNIDVAELQLNSPTCPVSYNDTHLTAVISLEGCGTKTVHVNSDLVFTNTLRSVRPYTLVSRKPTLTLPLACRFPRVQAHGPQYESRMPTEKETFGEIRVWMEFHFPGLGPLGKFTADPKMRTFDSPPNRKRREAETQRNTTEPDIGSRLEFLDMYLMSNITIDRVEMIVSEFAVSDSKDFSRSRPLLREGCASFSNMTEIITPETASRVYRIYLPDLSSTATAMYVESTVIFCITTMPSLECPDLCTSKFQQRSLVNSLFTQTYTVTSGPISLVVTTPAPVVTSNGSVLVTTTNTAAPTTEACDTESSHAPERVSAVAAALVLMTVSMFLHNVFLY